MTRKEMNAERARKWLAQIEDNKAWSRAIRYSIANTFVRKDTLVEDNERLYMSIKSYEKSLSNVQLTKETTYDAANRLIEDGALVGILNFASYFNPGGGFLKGAGAQEESLCHVSGLFPILYSLFCYGERRADTSIPTTYYDEVIYSKNVPFTSHEGNITPPNLIDVISVAAPNCNRVPMTKMDKYEDALRKRIEAIVILPFLNGCDTLILGAWGCGVFKNDPKIVSKVFKETLLKYGKAYNNIIFALPNEKVRLIFEEEFKSEE